MKSITTKADTMKSITTKNITKNFSRGAVAALSLALVASVAHARTDVPAKIAQLKENTENSKVNLKQYEEALKTVASNLAEAEKALKMLERQKDALTKQTDETAKGKMAVDGAKKQLEGYMKTEQAKLDTEKKQIEDIRKALQQLEANVIQREVIIGQYKEKLEKVDAEFAAWSERNQSIVELERAIKEKQTLAKTDQKRLSEKKASYEEEVGKWRKQARVSERQYENFSKLKD